MLLRVRCRLWVHKRALADVQLGLLHFRKCCKTLCWDSNSPSRRRDDRIIMWSDYAAYAPRTIPSRVDIPNPILREWRWWGLNIMMTSPCDRRSRSFAPFMAVCGPAYFRRHRESRAATPTAKACQIQPCSMRLDTFSDCEHQRCTKYALAIFPRTRINASVGRRSCPRLQ